VGLSDSNSSRVIQSHLSEGQAPSTQLDSDPDAHTESPECKSGVSADYSRAPHDFITTVVLEFVLDCDRILPLRLPNAGAIATLQHNSPTVCQIS